MLVGVEAHVHVPIGRPITGVAITEIVKSAGDWADESVAFEGNNDIKGFPRLEETFAVEIYIQHTFIP